MEGQEGTEPASDAGPVQVGAGQHPEKQVGEALRRWLLT